MGLSANGAMGGTSWYDTTSQGIIAIIEDNASSNDDNVAAVGAT